ncbi:MAG: hypothetical protein ACE5GH_07865 [Fidelibacterota bacterium]
MAVLLLMSCQKSQQASVDRFLDTSAIRQPLRLRTLTGVRDGYYVYVHTVFIREESPSDDRSGMADSLTMDLSIRIGVPSRFLSGTFELYGDTDVSRGAVTSSHIYFAGGQGGLPGFGGTFLFRAAPGDSFKVYIPPSELRKG